MSLIRRTNDDSPIRFWLLTSMETKKKPYIARSPCKDHVIDHFFVRLVKTLLRLQQRLLKTSCSIIYLVSHFEKGPMLKRTEGKSNDTPNKLHTRMTGIYIFIRIWNTIVTSVLLYTVEFVLHI